MSSLQLTLLVFILVNAIAWIVLYIRMVHFVHTHGGKVTLFGFEFMFPIIKQYCRLRAEVIEPGANLFPAWLISINLNLLLVLIFVVTLFTF